MPDPDAEVVVQVTADAAAAAAEIQAKFEKAVAAALRSPGGRKAIEAFINDLLKGFAKVGKSQERMWSTSAKQGTAAANKIAAAFERVGKSSQKAFTTNALRGSAPELQALNALVAGLANNFAALATDVRTTNTVIKEMSAGARAQLAAVTQEQRTLQQQLTSQNATLNTQAQERANKLTNETKLAAAQLRLQTAQVRTSSAERIAHIRQFTQIATTSIRALTQVFRTVFNGATNIVRSAVNGMNAVIRGIANAFRSAFSAINGIVRSFASGFSRAFSGIGRGVTSALSAVSRAIRSALSRDEAATRASMNRRERMAAHSAGQQRNFLTTAFQASGLAGGAAGIFGILRSGFERFSQVETLQFRFERFLGSAQKAKDLISDLSDFARTTAFDLPGVANLATNFLAMGQSASEATTNVRRLADVTAFAGGNTESLERIQRALGQIISTGKLQGDELNQLAENLPGINIRKIIADQMGVSTAELAKMQESGDISADAFITAFLTGIDDPRFQGAAVAIAGTLEGRLANLKESFGIFGAEIIGLVYEPIAAVMTKITDSLQWIGDFVSGDMFKPEAVHAEDNPYVQMADDATIAFEKLPKEWQNQLGSMFGWTAGEGFVVSKADAVAWWDAMHPPDAEATVSLLERLRDVLGDFVKGVGGGAAVASAFKAIAFALRFLISPMTAAIALFGGLGVFWGRILDATPELQSSLELVGDAFGNLRSTFGETLRLAGELISNALFGNPEFFHNIGLKVREFTNALGSAINRLNAWLKRVNALLSEGKVDEVIASVSRHVQDFAASLLGLTDAQQEAATALGGNDFGNIFTAFLDKLENVPVLGPVVGFVRRIGAAIYDAVAGFVAFAGDIWGLIFHDKSGSENLMNAALGQEDQRTQGQKILDRLEDTFLGPIVRFFRGPFMDAIHAVGRFVGDLFSNFLVPGFKAVVDYFAHDFIPGLVNVAGAIGRFLAPAVSTIGDLLGQVGTLLAPLGSAISGFIGTWQDEGIGGALSSLWDGVVESAGNLWDGEDGTGGIKAGLQSVIDSLSSWFSTTFTGKNAESWITSALDGLRAVGEKVGRFIASPEFLGSVLLLAAGIAATVLTIIGAFTVGFVQGVAAEVPRWGKIIANGMTLAWNSLTEGAFGFIPDPIANAIAAVLGNAVTGSIVAVALTAAGGVLVKKLIGSIAAAAIVKDAAGNATGTRSIAGVGLHLAGQLFTAVGKGFAGVGKGALSLAQMILPKFPADTTNSASTAGRGIAARIMGGANTFFRTTVVNPIAGLKTRLDSIKERATANFGSVGTAIGAAVVGGIAAYEFGSYAGKKGDAGSIILALLSGAATGASIGAALGGGAGAAIGALLGAGISGLGVIFGEAAKQAEDLKTNINEVRDALDGLSGGEANQALYDLLTGRLLADPQAYADWGQALVDSGFDFENFVAQIVDGSAEADRAFVDFLGRQGGALEAAGGDVDRFNEVMRKLAATATTGDYTSFNELFSAAGFTGIDLSKFLGDLDKIGLSVDDVNHLFGYFQSGVEGGAGALKVMNAELELTDTTMDTVEEGLAAVNEALARGATGDQIADILGNADLTTAESMTVLSDAADEVARSLDKAKQAFSDALDAIVVATRGEMPTTFQNVTDQIIADLPSFASQYQSILESTDPQVSVDAQLRLQSENFAGDVAGAIKAAVDEGIIVDDASMDSFIEGLRGKINEANLPEPVENQLNAILDTFAAGNYDYLLDPIVAALSNQQKIREAATALANTFAATFGGVAQAAVGLGGPAALGAAISRGGGAAATAPTQQIAITLTPVTQAQVTAAFDDVDTAQVGKDLGDGLGSNVAPGVAASSMTTDLKNEFNSSGASLHGTAESNGFRTGLTWAKSTGDGVKAGGAQVATNAGIVLRATSLAADVAAVQAYQSGLNISNALSRGIRQAGANAIIAAVQVANAVANTVKRALQIHSPSAVFVDIGRQVGAGFVKGIEDSTVSMTSALETALTTAIATATDTAYEAVNRSKLSGELFKLLQPSTLPGGTTTTAVTEAGAALTQTLAGFGSELRSILSDSISKVGQVAYDSATVSTHGIYLDLVHHNEDMRGQLQEAQQAQQELATYDAQLADLRAKYASGQLGVENRNQQAYESYVAVMEAAAVRDDAINRVSDYLRHNWITQEEFQSTIDSIQSSYKSASDTYYAESDRINRQLASGLLNQEEYTKRLADLGDRPTALTFDQGNILATGIGTLDMYTVAGRSNRDALTDAISKVKEWGQAAIEAGAGLPDVINGMGYFVGLLTEQAAAIGINSDQVNQLVSAYGVSSAQLANLLATYTSLDIATAGGAANIQKLNAQLTAIREYAQTLLESGEGADSVTGKIRALRDQFTSAATNFGFNASQVNALVEAIGLSDAALAGFIQQIKDFEEATRNAQIAATKAGSSVSRPVGELHVHVPYGDPEAIALATANRIAYDSLTSWN